MMVSPVKVLTAAAAFGWSLSVLLAHQPGQETTPRFSGAVDVVQVDVRVLDRDRRPVQGLTLADFTVLENGRPRPIVGVTPVTMPPPARVSRAWA